LYVNARWHAVAKLRMQTEPTLAILEQVTALLGEQYRSFIEETANIETLELPKEAERRMKAASKKSSKARPSPSFRIVQAASSSSSVPISSERGVATESNVAQAQRPPTVRGNKTTRRAKKLNISTIKFHVIGHYPKVIRHFGPSDLFSTEWGEHWHGKNKGWSKRTSRKFIRKEISQHERRQARVKRIRRQILSNAKSEEARELHEQQEAARNPDIHHYIGQSQQKPVLCTDYFQNGSLSTDVACSSFIRNLKQHLLPRFVAAVEPDLDAQQLSELIQAQEWANIILKDNRFYSHKIMRIKYTIYNTRRDEDIIHLDTDRCNVMLLNPEYSRGSSSHPFRYAKVIGILHAQVGYVGSIGRHGKTYEYRPTEFLWVRWYRVCPAADLELDKAELLPLSDPESLGFIDPNEVLRACHMIPCFKNGKRYPDGKGMSEVAGDGTDWNLYFINRFVDRDMFMRYEWGLAVGHVYTHRDAMAAYRETIQNLNPDSGKNSDVPRNNVADTSNSNSGNDALGLQQEYSQEEGGREGNQDEEGEDEDEEGEEEDKEEDEGGDGESDSDNDEYDRRVESEEEREVVMFGED
ncbi:hypothetical protein EST38_g10003, partial [Candolleomyces aberdarensis]